MANEYDPISINLLLETKPVAQATFGLLLILGTGAVEIQYQKVASESDLVGFTSTDTEYKMAQAYFSQSPRPSEVVVYRKLNATSYTDALDDLISEHDDWYCLIVTSRTVVDLHECADWINSRKKIFVGTCSDKAVLTGRSGNREFYILHTNASTTYHDAIATGRCLTYEPGVATWNFKTGVGAVSSGFNPTDRSDIRSKHGNQYSPWEGDIVLNEGKVMSGEFMDIIIARDFTEKRIKEEIARVSKAKAKIPYDLDGFAQIESSIRSVLSQAGQQGIIAKVVSVDDKANSDLEEWQYKLILPTSLSSIPVNDQANQKMPFQIKYRPTGAIHNYDITGVIAFDI